MPQNYIDEFNLYYDITQGIRHMQFDNSGTCQGLKGDTNPPSNEYAADIGYNGNSSFADVGGVILRGLDWKDCKRGDSASGLSILRSTSRDKGTPTPAP